MQGNAAKPEVKKVQSGQLARSIVDTRERDKIVDAMVADIIKGSRFGRRGRGRIGQ